ncbi:fatty acid CoA ligase family protein [Mariniblastus sp.]|nr:fatty acid CoA ligase family protein [Mariniblastus sp.]MDA7911806.1 fatty acid CoA ligase family protein [bacterium]MDA7924731.1 fatty acid CoA ligase family protein [Mariniblastus sp.]MDA7926344.1 fatty acid CoA ligase family protein [Mariniblastus sp.]MDA7928450.1 fatty acid CoA ligase family protein [Mariniblastus sp.]
MTTHTPAAEFHPLSLDSLQNIGYSLTEMAQRMPNSIAVACPRKGQPQRVAVGKSLDYETITFAELERKSNQIANGLIEMGVQPGMRIALMVPPGIDFVASVFGLFKSGVVTILIDPGMGRKNMLQCLSDAKPEGILGIPLAHLARSIFFSKFPNCKLNVAIRGFFPGCKNANRFFKQVDNTNPPWVKLKRNDPAAIIFTTGSTGPPKGVLYRHRIFIEQCEQIANYFRLEPGKTDVSGFPLFALFNVAMGTTTVFPQMDPTRPANVYPPNIIDAVEQFKANQSFGSPALWNTVANYCVKHSKRLPTIERILSAGAPVPPPTLRKIKEIISADGDTFTPYGATESLPIACNSGTVVLGETADRTERGEGTCVGKRFPKIDWKVIAIDDKPILEICDTVPLEKGVVGELIVRGPVVSDQYVTRTDANANHKITDGDTFWHRMGDVGYLDEQDRFWFCGRKTHRVQTSQHTMFTIPCEAIINTHPEIYRSALVGIGLAGEQRAIMICEPNPEHWPTSKSNEDRLLSEIKSLAGKFWQTNSIDDFLLHRSLPVDIRHNSKIFREQLRGWAKREIGL